MFSKSAIAITTGGGTVITAVGDIAITAGMGTDIGRTVTTAMRQGSILADLDLEAITVITDTMVITATTDA